MQDADKTEEQLLAELAALRQRNAELEAAVEAHTAGFERLSDTLYAEEHERKQALLALRTSDDHQQRLAAEQASLAEIGRIISASPHIDDVYELLTVAISKLLACDRMTITLVDLDAKTITNSYAAGTDIPTRRTGDIVPLKGSMTEAALHLPQGFFLHPQHEIEVVEQFPGLLPLYRGGLRSFLAVPLISQDRTIGVLQIQTHLPNRYTDHALQLAANVSTQVAGAIAIAELYRERHLTEQALRESETRFKELFENSPAAISLKDQDGRFRLVNKQFETWYGVVGKDVAGKTSYDIFPPEYAACYVAQDQEVIDRQSVIERELTMPFVDGSAHLVLVTKYPVYDTHGRPVGVGTINTDITEKRQAEEERHRLQKQLQQAQKMEAIGTLAGGIAHEFNNLLSVILGFTDLTQRTLSPTCPEQANLRHVLQAGERARDLVQQILAFSRQDDPGREPMALSQMIQDTATLLRASLPTTIDLRLDLNKERGAILADATQVQQILMNLCANAEYAMREIGGVLEISVDTIEVEASACPHLNLEPGAWVRLTVHDTGAGIPAEITNRIFDPFFTTKGVGEGTGMGLAIVHGIVERHGGSITVASQLGEGTTFTLCFPQLLDHAFGVSEALAEVNSPCAGRVLWVDDEAMLARLGREMLTHLGYDVVAYTQSLEALAAFQADPYGFALVIADQTMPVMTGERLVQELRRLRSDIPIILCTGFSHQMSPEQAQALGIDAFVMKPVVMQQLAAVIEQVFAQRAGRETRRF